MEKEYDPGVSNRVLNELAGGKTPEEVAQSQHLPVEFVLDIIKENVEQPGTIYLPPASQQYKYAIRCSESIKAGVAQSKKQ